MGRPFPVMARVGCEHAPTDFMAAESPIHQKLHCSVYKCQFAGYEEEPMTKSSKMVSYGQIDH
jgi:hypothetical protein